MTIAAHVPSRRDLLQVAALVGMRRMQRWSIEWASRYTWVPSRPPPRRPFEIVPARSKHGADLPPGLLVAEPLPAEGRLGWLYVLPYYGLAKVGFEAHRRVPIDARTRWRADAPWEPKFGSNGEGWGGGQSDQDFVRLRLSGPNPFLLERLEDGSFVADHRPFFGRRGAVARFGMTEHGLRPTSISPSA
jgi:hypothetical protein